MILKKVMSLCLVLVFSSFASATLVTYDSQPVNIEGTVGSGSNETMIVIDWESGVTESHSWLYQWDGAVYVDDALNSIAAAFAGFSLI